MRRRSTQRCCPELKTKYIDTGQARLILREFPFDGLAVAAFMLARCAGPDRYYPMVGALFETQETWAVPGAEGKEKLLQIAKQAGFTKEKFDQCIGDKELFEKIVETRTRGNEKFGVKSTPSFFVNGKRLTGEQTLAGFRDRALAGRRGRRQAGARKGKRRARPRRLRANRCRDDAPRGQERRCPLPALAACRLAAAAPRARRRRSTRRPTCRRKRS